MSWFLERYGRYLFLFVICEMKDDLGGEVRQFYRQALFKASLINGYIYVVFVTTFVARYFGVVLHSDDGVMLGALVVFSIIYLLNLFAYHSIGYDSMQQKMSLATEADFARASRILDVLYLFIVFSCFLIVYLW